MDLDQMGHDLSNVKDTLSDLRIGVCYVNDWEHDRAEHPINIRGSLSQLVDFPVLRRCEAPIQLFLGMDKATARPTFPRWVEILTLHDNLYWCDLVWRDDEITEALRPWISDWKMRTPRLRHLHHYLEYTEGDWLLPMRKTFGDLCMATELPCKITNLQPGWDLPSTP